MKDSEKLNSATHTIQEHLHRHVSIWIDSYDDVFSDFDPRSYDERNISDDFLNWFQSALNKNLGLAELKKSVLKLNQAICSIN